MASDRLAPVLSWIAVSLAGALFLLLFIGCSSVGGTPTSTGPTNSIPSPTTTLQAETGNNTSAANTFVQQPDGNESASNVSKLPLQSLLYSGANTKIYVTLMGWFGRPDHMSVGYNSDDPAQVHRQVQDMVSRGIQGAILSWYGPSNTVQDTAAKLLKTEAEASSGQFEFAIREEQDALGKAARANGCDVTDQLISDLTYIASEYESSPAYMHIDGRPVVFFFSVDAFYIDWNRVASSIPGNPLLVFRGAAGLSHTLSDGGFSWVDIKTNDAFNEELAGQDSFYQAAQQGSSQLALGAAYKGFNDTLAAWGTNRIINQHCGQTWLQSFAEAGKYYSSSNQLPGMQIVTWNDYEEGTAIEPGIDNCVYLTPSQSGTTINWTVNGGDESTIDHYTVFISSDGKNLSKLADVPAGTHSYDLSGWIIPSATYSVYVKATGKPSIRNQMSPALAYHPSDQPPGIQLKMSQTGALTYNASTTGSSGSVARAQIDFGDGTIVSKASASHTYKAVGTYLITASVYDSAGASSVAVQQVSTTPQSGGVKISSPANGATVNWPTTLVASANSGTPVSAMKVLIDGQEAYAAYGDTLNTTLKVYTGSHEITVQSLDASGNTTGSASLTVVAEPTDIPPVADVTFKPLTSISATTVLACMANSTDADGFINKYQLQFSNGSSFTTPAAVETFPAPGTYTATVTAMDQFGATGTTSTTVSAAGATAPAVVPPTAAPRQQQQEQMPWEPMGPPL